MAKRVEHRFMCIDCGLIFWTKEKPLDVICKSCNSIHTIYEKEKDNLKSNEEWEMPAGI